MTNQTTSRWARFYEWLLILSPWAFLIGLFHYQFQSFLPYQRIFRGLQFFDFITFTDFFIGLLLLVFLIGAVTRKIKFRQRAPFELLLSIALLTIAAVIQFAFQKTVEPILTTPTEYFRSLFVFSLLYVTLLVRTADERLTTRLIKSYLSMIGVFCLLALVQHFSGVFPGEQKDFMGRLVWPFIDFVTLKSSSANWVAFFTTPAFLLSFIHFFKKRDIFSGLILVLTAAVIYLTQSYGAYIAIFCAILFYLFRGLPFKKFLLGFLILILAGGGVYLLQTTTWKYKVLTGESEYRFETSATSRAEIYRMSLHMIATRPWLGVGLNQYQSVFAAEHEEVFGHKYNESHIPPHAHNFFMSFWTSLGLAGFLAMVILVLGIFWRTKLSADYPAVFVLIAIMIHGLIDAYYWKQEIAYAFWLVVALTALYRLPAAPKKVQ